jgi:hypothetical protein
MARLYGFGWELTLFRMILNWVGGLGLQTAFVVFGGWSFRHHKRFGSDGFADG